MTNDEYIFYANATRKLFCYMNGRVNTIVPCYLEVNPYDNVGWTYGNIRYPNHIFVNIGNIIDNWKDEWTQYFAKHDYICSFICWTLSHELHHADQVISINRYGVNDAYRKAVEDDVELASRSWVIQHAAELEPIVPFHSVIDMLTSTQIDDWSQPSHYSKNTIKGLYIQTLGNIVMRDVESFQPVVKQIFNDESINTIYVDFNGQANAIIKLNGEYPPQYVDPFMRLVYQWAGAYDNYNVSWSILTKNDRETGINLGLIRFELSNRSIEPMLFSQDQSSGSGDLEDD